MMMGTAPLSIAADHWQNYSANRHYIGSAWIYQDYANVNITGGPPILLMRRCTVSK